MLLLEFVNMLHQTVGNFHCWTTFLARFKNYTLLLSALLRDTTSMLNVLTNCPDVSGQQLLQTLCNTRWSACADNLEVVANCFPAIVAALSVMSKDAEANGLLSRLKTFEFVFGVAVLHKVLKYCQ